MMSLYHWRRAGQDYHLTCNTNLLVHIAFHRSTWTKGIYTSILFGCGTRFLSRSSSTKLCTKHWGGSECLPSFLSPSLLFFLLSLTPLRCAARWLWAARLWPAHKCLSSWYGSNCLLLVCYSGHRSEWFHHIQGAAAGADQWELVTLQSWDLPTHDWLE